MKIVRWALNSKINYSVTGKRMKNTPQRSIHNIRSPSISILNRHGRCPGAKNTNADTPSTLKGLIIYTTLKLTKSSQFLFPFKHSIPSPSDKYRSPREIELNSLFLSPLVSRETKILVARARLLFPSFPEVNPTTENLFRIIPGNINLHFSRGK